MKVQWQEANRKNYAQGRSAKIDRIVIHLAAGTWKGTLDWFQNPLAGVSAHFTVSNEGVVSQSVSELNTAYHAGPVPPGRPEMNPRSIGIEHEGFQDAVNPWQPTEKQLQATAELVAGICQRWSIPVDRTHIIGHNEVYPGRAARANCPGKGWPWERFLKLVQQHMAGDVTEKIKEPVLATIKPGQRTVRLMNAVTNAPLGSATEITGTDKVYLTPETVKQMYDLLFPKSP